MVDMVNGCLGTGDIAKDECRSVIDSHYADGHEGCGDGNVQCMQAGDGEAVTEINSQEAYQGESQDLGCSVKPTS